MSEPLPEKDFNPFATPAIATPADNFQPVIDLARYSTVRIGLQLIYYSVAALALMVISLVVLSFVVGGMQTSGPGGPPPVAIITILILGLGFVIPSVTALVGFCMCAACPHPNEKSLAVMSIIAFFLNFAAAFLGGLAAGGINVGALSTLISLIGNMAGIACLVFFCLLLKRIGKNIGSELMQKNSKSTLGWFITFIVVGIGGSFAVGVLAYAFASSRGLSGFSMLAIPLATGMLVLSLGTFFKFLSMLRSSIKELSPRTNA
ncbi:hypothetical protein [Mariniblastus fucicola]|uniref:Uncharacterized protein n=1 Tax=Mariniblastus fucicola TaxID=980251 RepID=A0A5B9PG50_9BACT|nr:hypothetical protein [Mariniblastus fucicola]QEG24195.1 hypothetical protein MFFC18_41120 [Mariniblastus fucicola]